MKILFLLSSVFALWELSFAHVGGQYKNFPQFGQAFPICTDSDGICSDPIFIHRLLGGDIGSYCNEDGTGVIPANVDCNRLADLLAGETTESLTCSSANTTCSVYRFLSFFLPPGLAQNLAWSPSKFFDGNMQFDNLSPCNSNGDYLNGNSVLSKCAHPGVLHALLRGFDSLVYPGCFTSGQIGAIPPVNPPPCLSSNLACVKGQACDQLGVAHGLSSGCFSHFANRKTKIFHNMVDQYNYINIPAGTSDPCLTNPCGINSLCLPLDSQTRHCIPASSRYIPIFDDTPELGCRKQCGDCQYDYQCLKACACSVNYYITPYYCIDSYEDPCQKYDCGKNTICLFVSLQSRYCYCATTAFTPDNPGEGCKRLNPFPDSYVTDDCVTDGFIDVVVDETFPFSGRKLGHYDIHLESGRSQACDHWSETGFIHNYPTCEQQDKCEELDLLTEIALESLVEVKDKLALIETLVGNEFPTSCTSTDVCINQPCGLNTICTAVNSETRTCSCMSGYTAVDGDAATKGCILDVCFTVSCYSDYYCLRDCTCYHFAAMETIPSFCSQIVSLPSNSVTDCRDQRECSEYNFLDVLVRESLQQTRAKISYCEKLIASSAAALDLCLAYPCGINTICEAVDSTTRTCRCATSSYYPIDGNIDNGCKKSCFSSSCVSSYSSLKTCACDSFDFIEDIDPSLCPVRTPDACQTSPSPCGPNTICKLNIFGYSVCYCVNTDYTPVDGTNIKGCEKIIPTTDGCAANIELLMDCTCINFGFMDVLISFFDPVVCIPSSDPCTSVNCGSGTICAADSSDPPVAICSCETDLIPVESTILDGGMGCQTNPCVAAVCGPGTTCAFDSSVPRVAVCSCENGLIPVQDTVLDGGYGCQADPCVAAVCGPGTTCAFDSSVPREAVCSCENGLIPIEATVYDGSLGCQIDPCSVADCGNGTTCSLDSSTPPVAVCACEDGLQPVEDTVYDGSMGCQIDPCSLIDCGNLTTCTVNLTKAVCGCVADASPIGLTPEVEGCQTIFFRSLTCGSAGGNPCKAGEEVIIITNEEDFLKYGLDPNLNLYAGVVSTGTTNTWTFNSTDSISVDNPDDPRWLTGSPSLDDNDKCLYWTTDAGGDPENGVENGQDSTRVVALCHPIE